MTISSYGVGLNMFALPHCLSTQMTVNFLLHVVRVRHITVSMSVYLSVAYLKHHIITSPNFCCLPTAVARSSSNNSAYITCFWFVTGSCFHVMGHLTYHIAATQAHLCEADIRASHKFPTRPICPVEAPCCLTLTSYSSLAYCASGVKSAIILLFLNAMPISNYLLTLPLRPVQT